MLGLGALGHVARPGQSICVNGVCLTLAKKNGMTGRFDVVGETLLRTTLGTLGAGDPVNMEHSLRLGDLLGGHLVMGHVDAVGTIVRQVRKGKNLVWHIHVPRSLGKQIAEKGSIAVDGVSLTVASVSRDSFSAALVPHTLRVTTLGRKKPGDRVNLETDILAKYVARLLS